MVLQAVNLLFLHTKSRTYKIFNRNTQETDTQKNKSDQGTYDNNITFFF